jgi:bifunctional UDP-N-acetylglucosamine pyrophosphorylase/glucosamine-1-phosphate N-acetyltransferase
VLASFPDDDIRWALQEEQHGTGHAVQQAMPATPDGGSVLVLFGDVPLLTAATLSKLVGETPENDMAVLTVDLDDPTGYGRIVREGEKVVRIVEQKDATADELAIREVNTGVMLCPADRLKSWLASLGNDNAQGEYYLMDIIAMAVADDVTVHGIKAAGEEEVMGINDKAQLAAAERALQRRRVADLMRAGVGFADPSRVDIRGTLECGTDVFIDVNAVFEGAVRLGDGVVIESNNLVRDCDIGAETVIHSNCHMEGAKMGAGCEIGPFARLRPGAVLEDRVKIGNFVEVKKSTINDGSKVNHLTYIGDTVIGKNVNVGAGTITCNYDGANKHQTVIGDGAFIGSGVELVAPIEIGRNATIGAGSTLTKSAPDEQLTLERARQTSVEGWQRPKKKT